MLKYYNEYLNEAQQAPQIGSINATDVNVSQNLLVDSEILIRELQHIDDKSDEELYKLIGLSYKILLDIDFINKGAHRIQIAKAFTNHRFVGALCNALSSIQLTGLEKIACNKLIYDYFTMTNDKDEIIINILYNLGWIINADSIAGLQGKGIDQRTMTYLAVARYSTTDSVLATKRVNTKIMDCPVSVMTEQVIVNIYEQLFNTTLTSLFTGIMFDTWDNEIEMDDEQEEIYGTINLAILDIVNEIPMEMIVQLMKSYAQTKQYRYPNVRARFDIHSISQDYSRILHGIQFAEADGIVVPHM